MLISAKWILVAGIPIWIFLRYLRLKITRSSKKHFNSELLYFLSFCYILSLVSITLFPIIISNQASHISKFDNYVPFKNILNFIFEEGMAKTLSNIIGNILLFIPLGYLLDFSNIMSRGTVKTVTLCAIISLLIEVVQFTGIPYMRQADIDDIILNTLGGLIGSLICRFYYKYRA